MTLTLKILLFVGLVVIAVFVLGRFRGETIDGAQARALVGEGALLLDVRTPEEFAESHLPGALNIPVDRLGGRLSELEPTRPVVVYCRSGARSAVAASALREAGFRVSDLGAMTRY